VSGPEFDDFEGLFGLLETLAGTDPPVTIQWAADPSLLADQERAMAERWADETRVHWSGRPGEVQRRILRLFRVSAKDIGLVPRSVFSVEYRRRQRARVKRRRR
jgi:hypothetical protein